MQKTIDEILNDAILETLPPVADYNNAIKILKDNYENHPDYRIAVLASFLSSTWQNFKPNEFLIVLDSYF